MKYKILIIILVIFIIFFLGIFRQSYSRKNDFAINKFLSDKEYFISPENIKPFKIGIITLETRKNLYIDIHNENVKNYATKYNYDYLFFDNYHNKTLELPIYWKKLQIVLDLLPKYDYVLWLDSDTIICHEEVKIEYLISKNPTKSIFMAKDFPCEKNDPYCSGVFLVKNDNISKKFLHDCIINYISNDFCSDGNNYNLKGKYAGVCYEQGVMNILAKGQYKENIYEVPNEFILNTGYPAFGTFILHLYNKDKEIINNYFLEFIQNHVELISLKPNLKFPKICILLTMYTIPERQQLYESNITKWINDGFDVYSVDSSGFYYNINNNSNYNQLSFKQNIPFQNRNPSLYEKDSILKVLNKYDFSKYDLIIKITGKYYLPEFKNFVSRFSLDTDILLQNRTDTYKQNCEIFGIRPYLFNELLSYITEENSMEEALYKMNKKYKSYRMPKLYMDKKVRRGDNKILSYL